MEEVTNTAQHTVDGGGRTSVSKFKTHNKIGKCISERWRMSDIVGVGRNVYTLTVAVGFFSNDGNVEFVGVG